MKVEIIYTRSADQKQATSLIFQVPESQHLLLKRALYIGGNGSLFPVPRGHSADEETKTEVVQEKTSYIVNFIRTNALRIKNLIAMKKQKL